MNRVKAALIHLIISICVFSVFLSLVYFIWYAYPFNVTEGVGEIVYLMAGIDIILGPLLTLIVFNTAKKSLKFDLTFIGIVQVAALIYGAYVIYSERPAWIAFFSDQFEVVSIDEIDTSKFVSSSLKVSPFDKPRYIYIETPKGAEMLKIVLEGLSGGPAVVHRSEFYRTYSDFAHLVKPKLKAISSHSELEKILGQRDDLKWLPLKGALKNIVVVVNAETAQVEQYLMLSPWKK